DPSDPPARLGEWLAGAGLEVGLHNLAAGDALPEDLTGVAGLVVLGGGMGGADDVEAPWLPAVRALLATAVARELPTLGVCLGAQLLALATGGRVGRNPDGPEFGAQLIAKRAATANDPLFKAMPITPDVIQWHYDAVLELPPGAVLLASSPTCHVQAFRIGRLAWGIQFHLETTPQIVRGWAANDARMLAGYDVERLLARSDAVHVDITEVWRPFAVSFADVVRNPSSVPAARRMVSATAEPVTDAAAIRAALAAEMQASRPPANSSPLPWPTAE
ncbi:MAG: type 1 glutamine amidotransferase, partial [Actinomycetota bacterium]